MSEIQELDVFIRPDGTVEIQVRGVKGGRCLELTAALEQLLGGEVLDRQHTDEFDQQEEQLDERLDQRL